MRGRRIGRCGRAFTLSAGRGPDRAIVTAVRFAGVDQPSFREPATLARDLRFAAPVDVDVTDC